MQPDHSALSRQRLGDRTSDPAAGAGHECHTPGKRLVIGHFEALLEFRTDLRLAGHLCEIAVGSRES